MLKRDATDAIFSDAVREAADWACERCHLPFPERKSQALHASHYFSRSILCVRFFPDNVSSLCGACHKQLGEDPHTHYRWMLTRLGEVRYDELRSRKNLKLVRYKPADKKAMRAHYRGEIERIKELRTAGTIGAVELVPYD